MIHKSRSATPRRRLLRSAAILLSILCVLYAALLAYLYFNQRALIMPGSAQQGKTEFLFLTVPAHCEKLIIPTSEGPVAALFGPALLPSGAVDPGAASRPTILYFYGSGGSIAGSVDQISQFQRLGANVLIPDYLGFGISAGTASEEGCYKTADAAEDYLLHRRGIDPKRIVFAGWSLGSAVAIDLAARRPPAGLIVFSAFTSMAEMGNSQYPIVPLPIIRLILKYRFLSEDKMRRISCPALICHSRADSFVPYAMSDRLASAAKGRVSRLTTDRSDHSDFFKADGPKIYAAVGAFLRDRIP